MSSYTTFCYGQLILTLGWQWIPRRLPETSVHRQKISLLLKISQNKPIRSFILEPFTAPARRFTSYSEMYSYPIYVYTCFLWSRVLSLSPFPLIKDGTFLDFTQPVVPLCLARGFGWRPTFLCSTDVCVQVRHIKTGAYKMCVFYNLYDTLMFALSCFCCIHRNNRLWHIPVFQHYVQ